MTFCLQLCSFFSKALRDSAKCSLFSWDFGRCLYCQCCHYCHAKVNSFQRKLETCTLTFVSRYSRLLSPFSTVQHYSKPLTIFIFFVFMACSYTRQGSKINVNTCKTANTVDIATTDMSLRFTSLLAITTGTRNKTKTGTSNTRAIEKIACELHQCLT